jgi:hypothetical protein
VFGLFSLCPHSLLTESYSAMVCIGYGHLFFYVKLVDAILIWPVTLDHLSPLTFGLKECSDRFGVKM